MTFFALFPGEDPSPGVLAPDLIPQSAWGQNLRAVLTRAEWRKLAALVVARAGRRCELCGEMPVKGLHADECWLWDEVSARQTLVRLRSVCFRCHEAKHYGRAESLGNGGRAIAWMCKQLHINADEVRAQIAEAAAHFHRRSLLPAWTLIADIDALRSVISAPSGSAGAKRDSSC